MRLPRDEPLRAHRPTRAIRAFGDRAGPSAAEARVLPGVGRTERAEAAP
jgi:hypothetical protein